MGGLLRAAQKGSRRYINAWANYVRHVGFHLWRLMFAMDVD
jgi:hypothetical protein